MSPRLGRRVAHFNRLVTNRVTGPLAPRLPGFGVVVHTGRKSGREYRTPVNVFRTRRRFVIALTYGTRGGLGAERAGRRRLRPDHPRAAPYELTGPQIVHTTSPASAVPAPVRARLRLLNVADFLCLEKARKAQT